MTPPARMPDELVRAAEAWARDPEIAVRAIFDRVREALPGVVQEHAHIDPAFEVSARSNVSRFFELLAAGRVPRGSDAPESALEYARVLVRRGVPLSDLLRLYRLGHGATWDEWARHAADLVDADRLAGALETSSEVLFDYIDVVSNRVIEVYDAERARWVRSAAASRLAIVRDLLEGLEPNPGTEAALGYRLDQTHVGLVLWSRSGGNDQHGDLERTLIALQRDSEFRSHLILPIGDSTVWAWLGRPDPVASDALLALRALLTEPEVCIALGEPGTGLPGFRSSHHEARRCQETVAHASRPRRFTAYRAVELESFLVGDRAAARRYVSRTLGPLGDDDQAMARLRATIAVFFEERFSYARTARRLGLHKNTVIYRVRQAEKLIGGPLVRSATNIDVALRVLPLLSERPPTPPPDRSASTSPSGPL